MIVTATEHIMNDLVILVDANNNEMGQAEKLLAHQQNLLHRAFSIFIFRGKDLLLQQRAFNKYHCAGLWTNTCCSHPRPGETVLAAGERRLQEELGFHTSLKDLGWFHYNAHFSNGLSENEIDHVLIGHVSKDVKIVPNDQEIHQYQWVNLHELEKQLKASPHLFTPWLSKALLHLMAS